MSALFRLVFPSKEFLWQKYPSASLEPFNKIVFYMVRLKEHLLLYSGIIWKIASGNRQVRLYIQQQQTLNIIRQWVDIEIIG